jgi:CheY-like chemotaxis protein
MNLITNASEALGDKSGLISVSIGSMDCDHAYLSGMHTHEEMDKGIYVYLEVADTGCGMDVETRAKLFDPFFTTKFTGRGLGLAAVLGIVRSHRGAVKIHSESGRGTTFRVLFPVVAVEAASERHGMEEEDKLWRGSGTVLLVDDEAAVRLVAEQMLKRAGFSVLTAADGREAVELYRERSSEIICVLLDLTMPHMDGKEAFQELRRIRADVRVILSSGYAEEDIVVRFDGEDLAGFVQKPYQYKNLIEVMRQVLESS